MVETYYADPRLAEVYDWVNPHHVSEDYYLERAAALPVPSRVMDMGCGTGRLAVAIAAQGHKVTGVDPAPGMIGVARTRAGHETVTWVDGDASNVSLPERFDLIIMTGHAFQILASETEILSALANLRRHLARGGKLAFESRNPDVREWEKWIPERSHETVDVPGLGPVEVHNSIASEDLPYVVYNTHFRFPDGTVRIEPATLRFTSREDIVGFLHRAGFSKVAVSGGWHGEPWTASCAEIVIQAS